MFYRAVVICLVSVSVIYSKPVQEGLKQCYGEACPEDTHACEKISRVSEDKKHIVSIVRCLGLHNNFLQNFTETEPNPFGQNAFYQSYSYTGVFSYGRPVGSSTEPNYQDKEPIDEEVNEKKTEVEVFTE